MSNIGRRVKLLGNAGGGSHNGATSGKKSAHGASACGIKGDYATVVAEDHDGGAGIFVVVDNCDCKKPFKNSSCDGLPDNGKWFEWADDIPKTSNGSPCTCDWDIVMNFGCQCGGI